MSASRELPPVTLRASIVPAIPPRTHEPEALFRPAFLRLLAVQMSYGVAYSVFLLLPKYLRIEHAASAQEIGAISGTAVVAGAVFSPVLGLLGAQLSARRLLAVGLGLAALSAFGFALLRDLGPFVYALRFLQGLSWCFVFNVTATLAASCVPGARLAEAIGYLGLSMLCTNALAPLVVEPMAVRYGFTGLFWAAGFVALSAWIHLPHLEEEARSAEEETGSHVVRPGSLRLHYGSFLMGGGVGVMFTYCQPFALERGAKWVGVFFLGYVLGAALARTVFGRVPDRLGPLRVARGALGLYALVVFSAAWLRPSVLPLLGAAMGIAHGFLYPALSAAGLIGLDRRARRRFMGYFSGAFNLGHAAFVFPLGAVADRLGYPVVFWLSSAVLATGVWMVRRRAAESS